MQFEINKILTIKSEGDAIQKAKKIMTTITITEFEKKELLSVLHYEMYKLDNYSAVGDLTLYGCDRYEALKEIEKQLLKK